MPDEDNLTLVTRYPEQLSVGSLTLAWRTLNARGQAASGRAGASLSVSRILLNDLAGGQFAFHGASETGGTIDWQDSWNRKIALPGLVRLELEMAEDRPGPLCPTFIGQPRINGAPVLYNLLR